MFKKGFTYGNFAHRAHCSWCAGDLSGRREPMKRSHALVFALSLAIVPAIAPPVFADNQEHQAKISIDQARAKALSLVPGVVRAQELEHERGRWIYSFEIKPAGETRKVIKEVNIDADTGAVVSIETEKE
jgi:hypothetical protein